MVNNVVIKPSEMVFSHEECEEKIENEEENTGEELEDEDHDHSSSGMEPDIA